MKALRIWDGTNTSVVFITRQYTMYNNSMFPALDVAIAFCDAAMCSKCDFQH